MDIRQENQDYNTDFTHHQAENQSHLSFSCPPFESLCSREGRWCGETTQRAHRRYLLQFWWWKKTLHPRAHLECQSRSMHTGQRKHLISMTAIDVPCVRSRCAA